MTSLTNTILLRLLSILCSALLAGNSMAQCTTIGSAAYWETYGAGCGTPPVLTASANPVLGSVMALHTANLPPTTLVVVTVISFTAPTTPTNTLFTIPLASGCWNYLAGPLDYVVTFPFSNGADTWLGIPASTNWQGQIVHAQSAILTFDFAFVLSEMSNALCLHLGT